MKDLKISKELLIEVLGSEYKQRLIDWFQIEDDNFLRTYYDCGSYDDKGRPTGLGLEINIYEFAFKCKEWAENKGYIIFSKNKECLIYSIDEVYDVIECLNQYEDYFEANTEIESIVKACNWILENIK